MNDSKLVTLAILTYSKAQVLQSILEGEGIKAHIHNVNLIQPVISSGVRVRISEEDLPRALQILEHSMWLQSEEADEGNPPAVGKQILIPVDFSPCSLKACEFGFKLAARLQAKVILMHVYFTPIYMPSLSYDSDNYHFMTNSTESAVVSARGVIERVHFQFQKFTANIAQKISDGIFPEISYSCILKEGVVEEEILKYARSVTPLVIVMGTHGEERMEYSLIGSVAAEVIERSISFVYVIPEETIIKNVAEIQNIAFFTSFDQRDIVAFNSLVQLFPDICFHVTLIHISSHVERRKSCEDKLRGLVDFLKKKYPHLHLRYSIVEEGSLLTDIDTLVEEFQIESICIANYKRNIFARLFNTSMASKMLFHSKVPILVIK